MLNMPRDAHRTFALGPDTRDMAADGMASTAHLTVALMQVFCNALVPSGIAVMLACHTGGSDIVLGAQGMRAATQYLGAYLGSCKPQLFAA